MQPRWLISSNAASSAAPGAAIGVPDLNIVSNHEVALVEGVARDENGLRHNRFLS